ncbi:MAG: DNA-binding protein WhiA [Clostridiaceae bacterium]|nr:DNA-binding protein WhiA [Clostridiaceae bacterium]
MPADSFSESIRKDLSKLSVRHPSEGDAELAAMILCAHSGYVEADGLIRVITTRSPECADRFLRFLREKQIFARTVAVGEGQVLRAVCTDKAGYDEMMRIAGDFRARSVTDEVTSSARIRRAVLRGAFMACGNAADPRRAYQIELNTRDPLFAHALTLLMHAENIEPQSMKRGSNTVLYLKEGARITDFLAMIGAHVSLLRFENIRTDKEIRNQVNRVVNCDTANARRQAEACAFRGERLKKLLSGEQAALLPGELKAAAEVFVQNPGLSIKELGEMMDPPIGKSGMHHRLKKLERFADDTAGKPGNRWVNCKMK